MNQTIGQRLNVRVANFSNMNLPGEHLLKFDSEEITTIVDKLRKYTDLPYVFVAEKEKARTIAELLSALKAIRSACYPYALFSIDGGELDVGDPDLDIVKIHGADPKTVRERIDAYALSKFNYDGNKLRLANSEPLPTKIDVAIIGAGITGLYAADRLLEAGISFCILEKVVRSAGYGPSMRIALPGSIPQNALTGFWRKKPGPTAITPAHGRYWKTWPNWLKMCPAAFSLRPRWQELKPPEITIKSS
ncbi:MAG: FAD-dependent monooxygenase [Desulfobacterales bacterium]|nr:FAD-dependent monooxygenase [Desulfobacterales bacterium]